MKDPALVVIPEEPVLAAFAAMMLGFSPLETSPEAVSIAAMASRLADPRPPRRPGDVEGARAFRSVYALTRGQSPAAVASSYRADRVTATKAWIVLEATLGLRHRQRAALALRYVFGLREAGVARVIGASRARAREVIRAGSANISNASGGRVDVARHLRSIGAMLRENGSRSGAGESAEPRSVVKLLLSSVAQPPASRNRSITAPAPIAARPVYRVRDGSLPASRPPSVPRAPLHKPRRTALLLAACVAALTFLGAFAPTALLRPAVPLPLAAVPIGPAVREVVQAVPAAPAVPVDYRVRPGDTLWSIADASLGDAGRWQEVWRSNAGRVMADGSRFLDPDLIHVGWRLRLPKR